MVYEAGKSFDNAKDCYYADMFCEKTFSDTSDFRPEWVLENDKPCTERSQNVWYGGRYDSNAYIHFDMGCLRQIKEIKLIPHFSYLSLVDNVWGTKEYKLEYKVGLLEDWILIVEEKFEDESRLQPDCGVTVKIHKFSPVTLNHLKFTAVSYYGRGAALQYIEVN